MEKKSILIGALGASLLFVTIGAGPQHEHGTNTTVPESHVWEFYLSDPNGSKNAQAFSLNKVTGEVRKYDTYLSQPRAGKTKEAYSTCVPNY